jgi:hypothetical protein
MSEDTKCVNGCDRKADRRDLCRPCYDRDRYGACTDCVAEGKDKPAGGRDGLCVRHRRMREAKPCATDGCEKIATAAGLCNGCYLRSKFGKCRVDGCRMPANNGDGLCVAHVDRGACEHADGCDKYGRTRVDGVLLCYAHYNHATGRNKPADYDRSDDPTGLYVWRLLSGVPVYIGVTCHDVAHRNAAHLRDSAWSRYVLAPDVFVFVFANRADAEAAEAAAIRVASREFAGLANTTHNPSEPLTVDEVALRAAYGRRYVREYDHLDAGDIECLMLDVALDAALVEAYT